MVIRDDRVALLQWLARHGKPERAVTVADQIEEPEIRAASLAAAVAQR